MRTELRGKITSSCPAGDTFFDAALDPVGFLSWERTLQAHI